MTHSRVLARAAFAMALLASPLVVQAQIRIG